MSRLLGLVLCSLFLASPRPLLAEEAPSLDVLKGLYARCGSEIDWTDDWQEAARRAKAEGKPILVLVRSLAGFDVPDFAMIGPFSDESIVEIIRKRYVALRFPRGGMAPFRSQDSYGMGPFAFGTSVLIANEEGEIIGDTFTMESTSLYEFLASSASAYPMDVPAGMAGADLARWHLDNGELEKAKALLLKPSSAMEFQLRGILNRRLRKSSQALSDFSRSYRLEPTEQRAFETARSLLQCNAPQKVDPWIARAGKNPRALSLLGVHQLAEGRVDEAIQSWRRLVREHPESRWAWPIASYLASESLLASIDRDSLFALPEPEVLALLTRRPYEPLPVEKMDLAISNARQYLLDSQREDGSWAVSTEVMGKGETSRNPFVIAITSWSARALLSRAKEPREAKAIKKALSFLFDTRAVLSDEGEPFAVMDYFVWSKPSLLLFLADAINAGVARKKQWIPVMESLIQELREKQKPGGGWSYYMGTTLDTLDPNLNVSFSFVTAYVLLGLAAARDAGVVIPSEMSKKAITCLKKMYNKDGSYEYSLVHANENAFRTPLPAGAAGRGPLCSLALIQWDETSLDEVVRSLAIFEKYRATYSRELGKTLMHCGPQGQGCHYLMFDYGMASAACSILAKNKDREPFRLMLADQILQARTDIGSFLGTPLLGEHFATAMALWSLPMLKQTF